MTYHLKWLTADRTGPHTGKPYPPAGEWTATEAPELCQSGWHACRWEDTIHHINARLWIVELDGQIVEGADKVAAERLRLVEPVTTIDDRTLRPFAADCAERVLPLFEAAMPGDGRPRAAIAAARGYADGTVTRAAWDAAWAAARAAAGEAAGEAAGDAAWDAAWAARAAGDAAGAAAWAARAAGDAAGAAAWAARAANAAAWAAAGEAAREAAGDAAWAAAGDAAGDAERGWQTWRLLVHYAQLDPTDFTHRRLP
jgi:hypothetical protein